MKNDNAMKLRRRLKMNCFSESRYFSPAVKARGLKAESASVLSQKKKEEDWKLEVNGVLKALNGGDVD